MDTDGDLIVGFDILPSRSPRSKSMAQFACVVFRDGSILNEYPQISRRSLIRLIRELEPTWVSTDNIFEIVPDSKSLYQFVRRLPSETRIVQVTGAPPHQISLKSLAKKHDIDVRGKPTPIDSARIAAELTSLGVGHRLECFSGETEIKITRGRKVGRGGQSTNRYRRRMHSRIQQMTREIQSRLKEVEIEYERDIRESDFGYSSARIIAYSPLPAIRKLVSSKRGGDFNVQISPVRKRTEFIPLEPQAVPKDFTPKYFVLGVDPGTTAAICLLTLTGKIHKLMSKKGFTRAEIIRRVYRQGMPVLVASDVPNVPHFVDKLASSIKAEVFTPKKEIPVAEKNEIAREYSEDYKIRNAHERDALTAAVYALRDIKPKLDQIDKRIRDEGLLVNRNHLKALVIKGMPMSEAIASLTRSQAKAVEAPPAEISKEEPITREQLDRLRSKIDSIEHENEVLEEKIDDLNRLVEYHKFRQTELEHSLEIVNEDNYWRVKRDRELARKESAIKHIRRDNRKLRRKIKSLEERLDRLIGVKRLEMRGDMLAIKTIPHFTRECILEYENNVGIKPNDIILFEDASGGGSQTASMLIDRGVAAVVADTPLSHLAVNQLVDSTIPVIEATEVELQRIDEFAFINRKKFEKQMSKFMMEAREKARQRSEDQLVEMVEKYRRDIER